MWTLAQTRSGQWWLCAVGAALFLNGLRCMFCSAAGFFAVQDVDCLLGERLGFPRDLSLRRSGPSKIESSKRFVSSPHCIEASFVTESYGVLFRRIVTSWFMFCSAALLLTCWRGVHQFPPSSRIYSCPSSYYYSCPTTATDPGGELPATALTQRVGDFNHSMDP